MFSHAPGAGGPGSFQSRFEKELRKNGYNIFYKGDKIRPDLIFLVGGTTSLLWLLKMSNNNIPILQRIDGIRWLYKIKKVSLKYYLLVDFYNKITKFIHAFLADKIVYQSHFVKKWWKDGGWKLRKNTSIIHNGVSIPEQSVIENVLQQRKIKRLVILEGVIDYTPYSVKLLNDLAENLPKDIEIELYGKFEDKVEQSKLHKRLDYKGFLKREEVYKVLMGSVYLSLDIHPACPNTVAEAMACGSPVVGFKTGALPELVIDKSGIIVDYGSDPWQLAYPDVKSLREAIVKIFSNYDTYSENAYFVALKNYSLDAMFKKYQKEIENCLK